MNNVIGNRIKQKRKELHLTQVDIKRETKISNGNLSEIENGNTLPSAGALMALSRILGVSTDWILFGENSISDNSVNSAISDIEYNCLSLFNQLDQNDQEEILDMMKLKIKRKDARRKSSISGDKNNVETA